MGNPLTRTDVGYVAGFFQLTAWILLSLPIGFALAAGGTFFLSFPVGYLDRAAAADPWGIGFVIGFGSFLAILFGVGFRPKPTYFELREKHNHGIH